ncbi:MAG: tripartite tricarboxylate transporter substrate binding protein [Proteobacteria bacterium]|nr:tripartite tricarboxylate transporter substrate binding protein [Burkholderiales bacterium]
MPYAPGGGTDILARLVSERLGPRLAQTILVDNRPGAGGTVAAGMVAKSAPDGYTLLLADMGPNAIAPGLYPNLPYDAAKDFAPITQAVRVPLLVVASPSKPFSTLSEFIAFARGNPGKATFGSAGNGNIGHLAGELLKMQMRLDMTHVPYKGAPPLLTDTARGEPDVAFTSHASSNGLVGAGRLKVLGVAGQVRPAIPGGLQTMGEAGVKDFEASTWFGFAAPAGTPRPIVERLHGDIVGVLGLAEVRDRMSVLGMEIVGSTPEAFATHIQREIAQWGEVVRRAGAKPD